ncbi:hypothetical protein [Enterovirga sp.]|uniref:hypothetical protein n=1 Tax=Enterovirga sp. TaxID=2026350 RepID=UPI002C464A40|nr:hypothetical protein [Enterovirga sp.]HMO30539.1 hypothetical protein [Enterovirga sp.]
MKGTRSAALILAAFAASGALAQKSRVDEVEYRYLAFSDGEAGEQHITLDGVLQYKREAGERSGAWTLDICFPRRPELAAFDRLSAPAKATGGVYTASGQSGVDAIPVSARIETKKDGDSISLSGEIRAGRQVFTISETSARFQTGIGNEGGGSPNSFGSLLPNEISVKVPSASLRAMLDLLRREKALVLANQLVPGCSDLREGAQYVRLQAPPDTMPRLAEALKSIPDAEVRLAENYTNADGVSLPAAMAKETAEAVTRRFAETAAKLLGAEGDARIASRAETGEQVVTLTRQTETASALGLHEEIAITTLLAPDVDSKGGKALYLTQIGSRFVDPAPAPLALAQDEWESSAYTDIIPRRLSLSLVNAFAHEIGGEAKSFTGAR